MSNHNGHHVFQDDPNAVKIKNHLRKMFSIHPTPYQNISESGPQFQKGNTKLHISVKRWTSISIMLHHICNTQMGKFFSALKKTIDSSHINGRE